MTLDQLELELQMVMNYHVLLENEPVSFAKEIHIYGSAFFPTGIYFLLVVV